MKILVTGNQGYIGSVLVPILQKAAHEVIGYDIGYYKDCLLYDDNNQIKQISKDIRDIAAEDLKGIDAVIHLAALSNDPLGELSPGLTEEINLMGTLKTAELAKTPVSTDLFILLLKVCTVFQILMLSLMKTIVQKTR